MILKSIANPDVYKFMDTDQEPVYHGACQGWYPTIWQRRAGCGPCTAANIMYYLTHGRLPAGEGFRSRGEWIALMEELWKYVTPSLKGVNKMSMLYEPLAAFAQTKDISLEYHLCEVPEEVHRRPSLGEVVDFLAEALDQDAPIAFLNWCNGEVKNLDRWHWVNIIQLEFDEEKQKAYGTILDEGRLKKIDLALWLKTSTLGGGFVYFTTAGSV
ncbi:hypothetical protein [Desulfitobacterium chlororespirans]|uniref:Peptidase_C39 like family protein n=1 Tax=Desulfitobacterium chlororespirans DSM 11544 TaxID=1121395 RepID=A0A1M7UER7_9FIRM|nr:hypothetical protein [Desulfitobacterium chlororespirans]SHN81483.1 hypothetical protein SAMN02745215_03624 [Desulfitobacterium chlororespirans DSM 11544]